MMILKLKEAQHPNERYLIGIDMNSTTPETDIATTDTIYYTSSVYLATVGGLGIALNAKALAKLLKVTKVSNQQAQIPFNSVN